jgi:dynein regulatory complex subunit 2
LNEEKRQRRQGFGEGGRIIEARAGLQESLKNWRTKTYSNSRGWEDRNQALANEKGIVTGHYQSLKSSMDSFRATQNERLKQSVQAQAAERHLQGLISQSETILKLAEMCRKLETEQVRVMISSRCTLDILYDF